MPKKPPRGVQKRLLGVLRCRPPEGNASAGSAQKPPRGVQKRLLGVLRCRPQEEIASAGSAQKPLPVDFFGDLWYDIS